MRKPAKLLLIALFCVALGIAPCVAEAASSPMEVEFGTDFAPYDGIWVPFEDGFKLYLPRDWEPMDITGEQADAGLFYMTVGELPDDSIMAVGVSYIYKEDLEDLDDLVAIVGEWGCEAPTPAVLNGIPALWLEHPGNNYSGVSFFHPTVPGCAFTVYVTPYAGEFDTLVGMATKAVLYSLSPYPAE